jgi:hypothetical protein
MVILGIDPGGFGGQSGFALVEVDNDGTMPKIIYAITRRVPNNGLGIPYLDGNPTPDLILFERPSPYAKSKNVSLSNMGTMAVIGWLWRDAALKFPHSKVLFRGVKEVRASFGLGDIGGATVPIRIACENAYNVRLENRGTDKVDNHGLDALLVAADQYRRMRNYAAGGEKDPNDGIDVNPEGNVADIGGKLGIAIRQLTDEEKAKLKAIRGKR